MRSSLGDSPCGRQQLVIACKLAVTIKHLPTLLAPLRELGWGCICLAEGGGAWGSQGPRAAWGVRLLSQRVQQQSRRADVCARPGLCSTMAWATHAPEPAPGPALAVCIAGVLWGPSPGLPGPAQVPTLMRSQAGKLYLFRFVNAALMKWLDLSISGTACSVGIVGRDGIPLSVTPRVANHIALSSANRRACPAHVCMRCCLPMASNAERASTLPCSHLAVMCLLPTLAWGQCSVARLLKAPAHACMPQPRRQQAAGHPALEPSGQARGSCWTRTPLTCDSNPGPLSAAWFTCAETGSLLRRAEAFVVCSEAGNYTLRTGSGPFTIDPNCNGTHCALVIQPTLATLVVEVGPRPRAQALLCCQLPAAFQAMRCSSPWQLSQVHLADAARPSQRLQPVLGQPAEQVALPSWLMSHAEAAAGPRLLCCGHVLPAHDCNAMHGAAACAWASPDVDTLRAGRASRGGEHHAGRPGHVQDELPQLPEQPAVRPAAAREGTPHAGAETLAALSASQLQPLPKQQAQTV